MPFKAFAATNEPNTCLWCGVALRFRYHGRQTEMTKKYRSPAQCYLCPSLSRRLRNGAAPQEGFTQSPDDVSQFTCNACGACVYGERIQKVVAKGEKVSEQPGPYGDGFFCTLKCAYDFAVAWATMGNRFVPKPK